MNIVRLDYLEKDIRDIIECIYKCCYTRGLSVEYDQNDQRYTLKLFLHDPNFGALVISNQCASDDEFKEFVTKELNERKLTRSQHYKLIIYGNNEGQERI